MFIYYNSFFIFLFIASLHYGGVSLHFVDSNFYLRVFVLDCKLYDLPNQKAHHTRDFLNTTLEEFNLKLNEDIFIVSDNEPKMVCASKMMQHEWDTVLITSIKPLNMHLNRMKRFVQMLKIYLQLYEILLQ